MRPFPLCACVGAVVAPGAGEVVPWPVVPWAEVAPLVGGLALCVELPPVAPWPAVGPEEPGAMEDPVPVLPAVPDVPLVVGAPAEGAAVEPLEGDDGLVDV
jgi:hypothetical protein